MVIGERLRYLDTDTSLIAESAPGLEEFASSPALVDAAEAVLRDKGFVDAAVNPAAPDDDAPRYLRGTVATGDLVHYGRFARLRGGSDQRGLRRDGGRRGRAHRGQNGAACLVLRAISDNCDESYDALCERAFELEDYARTASSVVLEIVRRIA